MKINQYNTQHCQNEGQKPHNQVNCYRESIDQIQHPFLGYSLQ